MRCHRDAVLCDLEWCFTGCRLVGTDCSHDVFIGLVSCPACSLQYYRFSQQLPWLHSGAAEFGGLIYMLLDRVRTFLHPEMFHALVTLCSISHIVFKVGLLQSCHNSAPHGDHGKKPRLAKQYASQAAGSYTG